jgi:pseudouridine kinase
MQRRIVPSKVPSNLAMPSTPDAPFVALIGGANLDISAQPDQRALPGDSNPGRIHCSPGGVARNVAENLLRLGVDARLFSVLGDDAFAAVLRQAAKTIGLDLSGCTTLSGARSATYLSLHRVDGDMGVAVNDMGILEQLTPALLSPHAPTLRRATALVVDCNVRPDVLAWLCTTIRHPALFAEAVSVAKCRKLLPVLNGLHTLKANRMEAQALSGLDVNSPASACSAARALHQRGVRQVVISLGAEGVAWCDGTGVTGHRAAQPVRMVNATGAGDALLSGLVYGHLHAMPLDQSVRFAMACAELTLSSTFANAPALCEAAVHDHLDTNTP